jgi:hypothetical protein
MTPAFGIANIMNYIKTGYPFSKLDSVAGMPNAIFQQWIKHPRS